MLKVAKFGGSSMADAGQYRKVKEILMADPGRRVVVVSAAGKRFSADHKLTDLLYLCHAHVQYGVACDTVFEMITSRYLEIRDELNIQLDLESEFAELKKRLDAKKISQDELVSRGEYFSAKLMAAYLDFQFIDATDWIKFNMDGSVNQEVSYDALQKLAILPKGVVTPGFYGVMPNDSIKTFGRDKELFFDLEKLVRGFVRPVDLIRCGDRYSVNICSVGLDARVCVDVHKYSRLPLIGGAFAYVVALIVNMIKGPNMPLTIRAGTQTYTGKFALMCACNGQYYGGGFHPVPEARVDDGIMDTLIVREVTRLQFFQLVGKYASGRYKEVRPGIVESIKGCDVEIISDEPIAINMDGEVFFAKNVTFCHAPGKLNMLFPAGMTYFDPEPEKNGEIARK